MNSARISCISKFLKQVETIICLTTFKYPLVFHKLKRTFETERKKKFRCLNENILYYLYLFVLFENCCIFTCYLFLDMAFEVAFLKEENC